MMMKQNKDWTDVMRSALHDAELPPAKEGWERLQRELEGLETPVPEPPRSVWRIYGPRIVAAAAAVLIGVVAGEMLLRRPDMELGKKRPVVASLTETEEPAVGMLRLPETGTLRKELAQASGWDEAPGVGSSASAGSGSSIGSLAGTGRPATPGLLAAVTAKAEASAGDRPASPERIPVTMETISETELPVREGCVAEPTTGPAPEAESAVREKRAESRTTGTEAAERTTRADAADEGSPARSNAWQKRSFESATERSVGTARRSQRPGTSLSLFAGGGMTGATPAPVTALRSYSAMSGDAVSIIGNGDNFSPMERRDYDESDFKHHLPLSFGLSVRKYFAYGLSLESGLNYTLLRSEVRMRYSSEDVSQKLHFVGVPLRLNWQFVERGRFSAYVGAGGMLEKCVSAKFGSETVDESAIQWSILAALGAQYSLGNLVGLYFEPEVSYYLTDTELQTSRSDAPLTLSLRVGVRLLF